MASADGRWLLCFTGRLDNHRELRAELAAARRSCGAGDAGTVLAAWLQWGEGAAARLRGDFALALADLSSGTVYLARDLLGTRPLYWSRAGGCLRVASQVKALVPARGEVSEVPPGQHGWAEPDAGPDLVRFADLADLGAGPPVSDPGGGGAADPGCAVGRDRGAGGHRPAGGGGGHRRRRRRRGAARGPGAAARLRGPVSQRPGPRGRVRRKPGWRPTWGSGTRLLSRGLADLKPAEVREAIRVSELTEYGDIINAVISVPVFRRAAELGLGTVLTGDGCAELFGGYPMYGLPGQTRPGCCCTGSAICGGPSCSGWTGSGRSPGWRPGAPFLDQPLVSLSMRMPLELKLSGGWDQLIVREAFAGLLPDYILQRQLSLLSHSSGLHERARLYRPLFPRMYRSFGYDLLEPLRRDFSVALRQAGGDLDTATAPEAAGRDYTPLEHARDLAGAVRRNVPLRHRGGAAGHRAGHRQPHPAGV